MNRPCARIGRRQMKWASCLVAVSQSIQKKLVSPSGALCEKSGFLCLIKTDNRQLTTATFILQYFQKESQWGQDSIPKGLNPTPRFTAIKLRKPGFSPSIVSSKEDRPIHSETGFLGVSAFGLMTPCLRGRIARYFRSLMVTWAMEICRNDRIKQRGKNVI